MQDIVIVGAGGFGREVQEIIYSINNLQPTLNLVGFIDDDPHALSGFKAETKIIGNLNSLKEMKNIKAVVGVGNPEVRKRISEILRCYEIDLQAIISPSAIVSPSASIGKGAIICEFTFVSSNALIGENVVLNVYSSVGHDAVIHSHSVVSPYAAITGNVFIGDTSFVGTHSTVSPCVSIGRFSKIASGSVATKDCPPGTLLSGNPAKGRIMFIPDSESIEGIS
jgi:sugar O-acyltransferase (sialic acid O-acetyltransferase NeuD family)